MQNEETDETPRERRLRESAEYAEAHMDDEPGAEVKFRVAKNLRNVYSLRIGAEELDEIADAAVASGQNISEFIRNAALSQARARKTGRTAVDEVREKANELAEAVKRL